MIHLRALGVIDLRNARGELRAILAQPKRLALLYWLAIERPSGFQTRDRARALFWPEHDDGHARRALNRAIYWLRQSLGEGVILSRGDEAIGLANDSCWTDVAAFEAALADGRHADAVGLYRGDLLRGFFVSEADGFERWLEIERQRLRTLAHEAGSSLTQAEFAKGNLGEAARWARWTLERSPFDEPSARRLISILDETGDRAGAVQAYDQFARHIAAELDLPPSPETQALVGAIRDRSCLIGTLRPAAAPSGTNRNDALASVPKRDAPESKQPVEPPLVVTSAALLSRTRSRGPMAIAVACAVLALVAGGMFVRNTGQGVPDPRRVVVIPFVNRTGDAAFDYLGRMTSDWIAQGLDEAGMVETSRQPIDSTNRILVVNTGPMQRQAPKEVRAGTVIHGAIYRTGRLLHFEATVSSESPRRAAWILPSVTAPVDSPQLAMNAMRDRATGASAALMNPRYASWLPLGTRTPPTFDAFQEFAYGDDLMRLHGPRDALKYFRRATELDTTFTWARLQVAGSYLNLLDTAGADSIARSLDRMHERLTPLELAWLRWILAVINEDIDEANRAMTRAADIAPDRFLHQHAEALRWLNRPAAIVKLLRQAVAHSPRDSGRGESHLARIADSYHQLGDHRRELAIAIRLRRNQPADMYALWVEIRALAALRRSDEVMDRLKVAESLPRHGRMSLGTLMRETAEEVRAHSNIEAAAPILDRTITWYYALPPEEAAKVAHRFEAARALYLRGRLDDAERLFQKLATDNPGLLPEYEGSLGVIAARRGDRAAAEAILRRLERQRLAMDPPPKYSLFAQARIVASMDDPKRAVWLLQEALGGQGLDLHMDADFEALARDPGFRAFIRPKG